MQVSWHLFVIFKLSCTDSNHFNELPMVRTCAACDTCLIQFLGTTQWKVLFSLVEIRRCRREIYEIISGTGYCWCIWGCLWFKLVGICFLSGGLMSGFVPLKLIIRMWFLLAEWFKGYLKTIKFIRYFVDPICSYF